MAGAEYDDDERRMRIISRKRLRLFWEQERYREAEQPLKAWFHEVARADWATPADVKAAYRSASIVANSRVVFNIAGNKYRVVVRVNYPYRVVYVRFIGTHRQYDAIDVDEV
jgi:mRNA interferase HigB